VIVIGGCALAQDQPPRSPAPVPPQEKQTDQLSRQLADLPETCRRTLLSLYGNQPQPGADGALHPIDATTRIKVEEGLELLRLGREIKASALLEIGMAYGFSSQFLLAALAPVGGRLVAVDPYQHSDWHGIGNGLVKRSLAALAKDPAMVGPLAFHCIEERSERAFLQLEAAGERFDLIFIDGYHRFDDVLIDVTLAARLCRPGGVLVLHDLWLPSVRGVVSFLEANRRDLQRLPTPCRNLGIFQVVGSDQRNWDHFVAFANGGEPWLEEA
jgi:predicted O-methyltransferase YrrM